MKFETRAELRCRAGCARDRGKRQRIREDRARDPHAIGRQPPEEDGEIRKIEMQAIVDRRFGVDGVGKGIERRRQQTEHRRIAHRHGSAARDIETSERGIGQRRPCRRHRPAGD